MSTNRRVEVIHRALSMIPAAGFNRARACASA
ncbi:hypothetical protein MYSI104531_27305 [Mycobacterium simiae]